MSIQRPCMIALPAASLDRHADKFLPCKLFSDLPQFDCFAVSTTEDSSPRCVFLLFNDIALFLVGLSKGSNFSNCLVSVFPDLSESDYIFQNYDFYCRFT